MPIRAALRKRYAAPGWAVFEEIPNVTGYDADRRADALALGVWPSHGYVFHGFEIKSARADWLRELQDPTKSDAFSKYCDHWWLLAEPKVALESEIPATWGWMESTKSGLRVRKDAPKLTPKPIPRSLMASMMRSVEKTMVPRSLLDKEREEMRADMMRRQGSGTHQARAERAEEQLAKVTQTIQEFEARTGVHLNTWSPEVTVAQVRKILDAENAMQQLRNRASNILESLTYMSKLAASVVEEAKVK